MKKTIASLCGMITAVLCLTCVLPLQASTPDVCCAGRSQKRVYKERLAAAAEQTKSLADAMASDGKLLIPCTLNKQGEVAACGIYDWRSGFFAGSLWYLYKMTGDKEWRTLAEQYDRLLEPVKDYTDNHDVGFMMYDSWGKELEFTGNKACEPVLVQTARSLCARYHEGAGVIQSWGRIKNKDNQATVIIDNMMNLELLFEAARLSGDDTFRQIALRHADNTLANHFRPDGSCYHVLEYDQLNGNVRSKHTAQGFSDESTWSRGHAWAIYGFTLMYRYTHEQKYLDRAVATFEYMRNHRNMPADGVPLWDLEVPQTQGEERDASSAAIIASALLEMAEYLPKAQAREYVAYSDKIMDSLSSPAYRTAPGECGNFLLKHSVGSKPGGAEVDKPLNYADYYYLEALCRRNCKK